MRLQHGLKALPRAVHQHPEMPLAHRQLMADVLWLVTPQFTHHKGLALQGWQTTAAVAHQRHELRVAVGRFGLIPDVPAARPGTRTIPAEFAAIGLGRHVCDGLFPGVATQLIHQLVAQDAVDPRLARGAAALHARRLEYSEHRLRHGFFGQCGVAHAGLRKAQQARVQCCDVHRTAARGRIRRVESVLHLRTVGWRCLRSPP
jgi:hypothetical protein